MSKILFLGILVVIYCNQFFWCSDSTIYILAFDFFKKDDKYVFKKLKIRVVFRKFLACKV